MATLPTTLALGSALVQGVAEAVAMMQTGTFGRRRRREWTFFAVNVPYWLLIGLGISDHQFRNTHPSTLALVVGTALSSLGVAIRVGCHYQLAGGFSPYVELSEQQHLVTTGLYRSIRHPMYLGSLCLLVGMSLVLASPVAWAMAGLASLAILVRIAKEERFLSQHLPGYVEYAQQTMRLVPGLW